MAIILGIDPSLNSTGWAVVERINNKYNLLEYGSILAKPGGDAIEKIKNITIIIGQIIKKYDIKIAVIEECFVNKNASSSLKLGMVRGGCIAISSILGASIVEYSPKTIKNTIVGNGSAQKQQLEYMIQHIIGKKINFKNDDESDAVCVGLTYLLKNTDLK